MSCIVLSVKSLYDKLGHCTTLRRQVLAARPRVLSNPPFLPLPYRHAISFHSDFNAQSSARPVHLRERLDAVVPTTEQYLAHHTLPRCLLGTSPYLDIALEVSSQVFCFRRHQLPKVVMRGSLREATLQMNVMPCRSVALCTRT